MQSSGQTDQQLVELAQKGDKRAFDLLVLKYQHKVVSIISGYLGDPHEAVDLAQDAFIRAYHALPSFRGDSQFYTWVYRIAINTAKNHIASRSRRPPLSDVDVDNMDDYASPNMELHDSPDTLLTRDELETAILVAIARLPNDLRDAIRLREFDGLSYDEIAEAMDCPVGTVRSRIFRAREVIDRIVAEFISA